MLCTTTALAALTALASGTTNVPPASAHFFKFHVTPRLSWSEASVQCELDGGYLAYIVSRAEDDYVRETAASAGMAQYWLGGERVSDGRTDTDWKWTNPAVIFGADLPDHDTDLTNDLWGRNEPNNFKGKEDCIRAGEGNAIEGWNDAQCFVKNSYVCRFEPTTTTAGPTTTTTAGPTTTTTADPTTTTTAAPTTTTTVLTTTTTAGSTTTTTEAPSTTTTEVPTTTTLVPTTQYTPDWDYFEGSGCWYKRFDSRMSWSNAKAHCAEAADTNIMAWLATPTSLEEAKFIGDLRDQAKPLWMGAKREAASTQFEAENRYTFKVNDWGGWYANEPSRQTSDAACMLQGVGRRKADTQMWKMNDADCNSVDFGHMCQYCFDTTTTTMEPTTTTTEKATTTTTSGLSTTTTLAPTTTTTLAPTTTTTEGPTTTTVAPTTQELPGWAKSPTTGCYYEAFSDKFSHADAERKCRGKFDGAHLATISSDDEAAFVSTLNGRGPGTPLWVGVVHPPGGPWVNIDGTFFSQTLDLFYRGEPNTKEETLKICAQMGYGKKSIDHSPEKLNDANCAKSNRFACEWCNPLDASTTTTTGPSTTTTAAPTTTTTAAPTTTTTAAPTTTTTAAPTTTTTATTTTAQPATTTSTAEAPVTPCASNLIASPITDPAKITLIQHIAYIAAQSEGMDNKKSGRTAAVKPTCETYCTGLAWGAACAPCALSALTTESACMFPGPFLTGELCHRNASTAELTDIPCCNLPDAEVIGTYDIARATTCVRGKQCNCKKFSPTKTLDKNDFAGLKRSLEKFPASTIYTMPRKFTEEEGCQEL